MHIYIYKKTFFFHWGLPFNSRVTHLHRTTMSADYLSGKYCVRFFRHLKVKNKVIVVICAGKRNIWRVDDICSWTEMWKQKQKMSSLVSRENLTELESKDRGKGKRTKGQKGKPQTVIFPKIQDIRDKSPGYFFPDFFTCRIVNILRNF